MAIACIGPKKPHRLYLKEWRVFRALTQEQLAEMLGTTKQTISRHERAEREVTTGHLIELASALNCEPGDLFLHPDRWQAERALNNLPLDLQRQAIAVIDALKRTGTGG